jgi:hypothetical protein
MEARKRSERKLHNEDLHNLYSSPNNIKLMELRSLRLAGNVVRIQSFGWQNLMETDHLEELCLDEKIIIFI